MLSYLPGMQRRKSIYAKHTRAEGTAPSTLQTMLKQGEYGAFGNTPIFESTFLQVTNKGEYVTMHNHPNLITMGILASNARLALPNYLVIAQERKGQKKKELELKRMIPMDMVDIFVHNLNQRRLKVQLISGKRYYLQLYAPAKDESFLFERWIRIIHLLQTTRGTVTTAMTGNTPKRKSPPPNKVHLQENSMEVTPKPTKSVKTGALVANVTEENLETSTRARVLRQTDPSRPGNWITHRETVERTVERSVTDQIARRHGTCQSSARERTSKAKQQPIARLPCSELSENPLPSRSASKKREVVSDARRSKKFISAGPLVALADL